jgi:hypothetical protein
MNKSVFDYVGNLDTLLAVVIGAMLATLGALFAELIQDRMNRRRRERDAARFFGEIMYTIDHIIGLAVSSQKYGDPWGAVTRRMFRTALREAQIYERNRERLFDVRDTALRTRVHSHFLSEIFPLEQIIDNCDEIILMEKLLGEDDVAPSRADKISLLMTEERRARDVALAALVREQKRTSEVCDGLSKLACIDFIAARDNALPATPATPPEQTPA